MNVVALSPLSPEPSSPVLMSMTPITPILDPDISTSSTVNTGPSSNVNLDHQSLDGDSSAGLNPSQEVGGPNFENDFSQRTTKPPPLHTGADWKVVLHLPEIEKWLRATSDRVTQLTHSVGQDSDNRHVDVHLVQLKDICEDISDHVEQIHALLETEFSLKLLSYSVNIIVDIRTVQLLWHQLRVSVLVLKERLLQGLQDSNGNFTRQTDILQAFSQDQHQKRLDALTEVDDCGQLTIRCSQDYFSLDCGITAFELSDYSPSDEQRAEPTGQDQSQESKYTRVSSQKLHNSLPELCMVADSENHNQPQSMLPTMHCGMSNKNESSKRPLQDVSLSTEVSPTHLSLAKRAALLLNGETKMEDLTRSSRGASRHSGMQLHGELSQSTPALVDPLDRSRFCLELDSVYPETVPQSSESLQVKKHQGRHSSQGLKPDNRSSSGTAPPPLTSLKSQDDIINQTEKTLERTHTPSKGGFDSSSLSPTREQILSSDLEASGEESDPQLCPDKTPAWFMKQHGHKTFPAAGPEHWYGSEEFLALPAQLHKSEILAKKLESLTQSIPLMNVSSTQMALQDVDDWELTEFNTDWDIESRGNALSTLPRMHRNPVSRSSPASSSERAPSLDESLESGPLSDLQSEEEEERRTAGTLELTAPPVERRACVSLVQQLLEDIQDQDQDPYVWMKMECFVQKLDRFILWLKEALDNTENWTQPRQDLDSLRVYLDTHLSFKQNVDSHGPLKESIMEEGQVLLSAITSHQLALKDILHMVASQWDQLQRQIRRQHGWMLRALRCIQSCLLYTSQSHEPYTAPLDSSAHLRPSCTTEGFKAELMVSQQEMKRAALEKMTVQLSSLKYPSSPQRYDNQLARSNSLQEIEVEYQELWDWLMDIDAMVTDSHLLVMSEEQRRYLFKSSYTELMMMESRKASLLSRAASFNRSGNDLPSSFHDRMHNLTHTWRQLEKILSEHSMSCSSGQRLPSNENTVLVDSQGAAAATPRSALSPLTTSLLEQLEARIKELKAWLRDTELLIFNSCLRQEKDASEQLPSFKSLSSEIRARRRGVASVLKLCQKLLQQSQSGPMAEAGPDAEQHREALQLLSINLERRWEAIVMQALQWQNRLKRELGEQQVNESFLEVGLVDLCQISPVSAGPVALAPDDSWEWDETDLTIQDAEPQEPDLTHNLPTKPNLPVNGALSKVQGQLVNVRLDVSTTQCMEISSMIGGSSLEVQNKMNSKRAPSNNNIVQVFSLYNAEVCQQPQFPLTSSMRHKTKSSKKKQKLLLKSISKDSSFSSIESLPDLLGGLMSSGQQGNRILGVWDRQSEGGRKSEQSENSCRSDCESGIVSDTGDAETTTTNSEIQADEDDQWREEEGQKEWRKNGAVIGHHLALQRDNITDRSSEAEKVREEGGRTDEFRNETKEITQEEEKRRGGGKAAEIQTNGHGIITLTSEFHVEGFDVDSSKPHSSLLFKADQFDHLEAFPVQDHQPSSPILSQHSSLESLLALDVELFPSKDPLHRSASLESCLNPCLSTDGEAGGSPAGLEELEPGKEKSAKEIKTERNNGESTSGELSRRTLDLLKRLENVQNPLVASMTRSVSDMTLQSSAPQKELAPVSPSLGSRHAHHSGVLSRSRKELTPMMNKNSCNTSLTELSSTEDSSFGSEDLVIGRNQMHLFLDPNSEVNAKLRPCRRHCNNNNQGGQGLDGTDVANLSMVVNVSCTSSCTDEDEDDSDLLSSSTLTLTEEELGVRVEADGDRGRPSGASSCNEEEDNDKEEVEGPYVLGLQYMRQELQSCIRCPRIATSSLPKTEVGLWDELQCGNASSSTFTSSGAKSVETNKMDINNTTKRKEREKEAKDKSNTARSYICQFVDDVENGNVDQSCLKGTDEDELLREESSVLTKKGDSLRELYANESYEDFIHSRANMESDSARHLCFSPSCELLSFSPKPASSMVGQLRGELPCHSSSLHSPPSLSPVEDCRSSCALQSSKPEPGGRKAITSEEKFKFSSIVTEETRKETRAKDLSQPPRKWHKSHSSCHNHLPSPSAAHTKSVDRGKKENVHDFVMEIIDLASVALKNKDNQTEGLSLSETSGSIQDQNPASFAKIRDKVLEHSHRPLQLRKGDFYSYLSLSSHDSDCGEVSQCAEDKSSTPVPYSIPCSTTPTQDLHSPSPELFTNTTQLTSYSHSDQASTRLSPGPAFKSNMCSLDLESAESPVERSPSPSRSVPPSPDIRDEETLFAPCTEEVYLGPPLCYSMVLTKKPQRLLSKPSSEFSSSGVSEPNETAPCSSQPYNYLIQGNISSEHPPSQKSGMGRFQDSLHFERPKYGEKPLRSLQCFSEPCDSSFPSFPLHRSDSSSPQVPPSCPCFVSSSVKGEKPSEGLSLSCDVAAGGAAAAASVSTPLEERSRNEGPPYLNPWVHVALIDSFAAECLEDIKTLESNMGAIMTKISVCSSATNPSKEPTTAATRFIPEINCSAMETTDRGVGVRCKEADILQATQEEKERTGWSRSQQEAKTTMVKQTTCSRI
uniref:A kinase (PRKA) anchor protein 6 n=3 Tax=Nothobranchius TaxID=28779 RepID=A0A1A8V1U2_NOTFU